jgi:hypothetical protein
MLSNVEVLSRDRGIILALASGCGADKLRRGSCDLSQFTDNKAIYHQDIGQQTVVGRFAFLCWILALFIALGIAPPVGLAEDQEREGGQVLPPGARPHGYSLEDMARLLAPFTTSGNDLKHYPNTPFQILYTISGGPPAMSISCQNGGTGVLDSGCNAFKVNAGMEFFVPLLGVDDSPPVLGTFPTDEEGAIPYFFGSKNYGGREFVITVDCRSTRIGPGFLAGPVQTPPLLDGGGTHFIQLGAFLEPLSLGLHVITVQGEIAGAGVLPTYGISCLKEIFSYFVEVVPY